MDEDCLYVNIWAPEAGFVSGNLPVLAIITGEDMAFDWSKHRPTGLDLADGVVVVSIQYRTNIFGFLATPDSGNFGLLDQLEALKWIQKNIAKFGGDNKMVTLLGHGTTGGACAMILMSSNVTENLFSAAIIMSGTVFSSYSYQFTNRSEFYLGATRKIVLNLACDAAEEYLVLACLRSKSVDDLLKAFENVYQVGNYTQILGPVVDNYLIAEDPRKIFQLKRHRQIPVMIGIANQEGAFIRDNWLAFAKQGPRILKQFIDSTIVPNVFAHYFLNHGLDHIRDVIQWRYFESNPKTVPYYMNALVRIVSETRFEIPFLESIEFLSNADGNQTAAPLFVYSYQQDTPIDMRGRVNYFGGAAATSDLPYLLGPSLLQQISRRRLTQNENKISKLLRQLVGDFVKTRNPTPGRIYDSWKPYTKDQKFIKVLKASASNSERSLEESFSSLEQNMDMIKLYLTPDDEKPNSQPSTNSYRPASYLNDAQDYEYFKHLDRVYIFWRRFLTRIDKNAQLSTRSIEGDKTSKDNQELSDNGTTNQKFKHAFFSMLTLVCLLLTILLVCFYLLKKNSMTVSRNDRGYL